MVALVGSAAKQARRSGAVYDGGLIPSVCFFVPLSGEIAVDVLGMKSHPNQDDDSPFNSPEEMLARLAFVLCLLALIAGIALVVIGVVTRSGWVALAGVGSLGVGWLLRVWL